MSNESLESRLWKSADQLRANSELKSSQYSMPVLGLIFLKYANHKFKEATEELEGKTTSRRRHIGKENYHALGALYLPEGSRFEELLNLPEEEDVARALNEAMKSIENENPDLKDVLPKNYNMIDNKTLVELLKLMSTIPDIEGDLFGKIYEYFLGHFAFKEDSKGGEFYTPTPLVKLIVEVIEPYKGRILDPACGSGGMFVQSADFIKRHKNNGGEVSVYGQERVKSTVNLCKMNLAVHGLSGNVVQGNTYYENLHNSVNRFEYVMANPPFNVDGVDKERLKDDPRLPYGLPNVDNANYIWIQIFYSALKENGRAGFVMSNSASDAPYTEKEIRKKILEDDVVDVIIVTPTNFFYTVTLSCTLWFLDKSKKGTDRMGKVLYIDSRHDWLYRQIDRAHREFTSQQIEFLANIVRLYRGEDIESSHKSKTLIEKYFPDGVYQDVMGLCKIASLAAIEEEGWSLNPGRYVGVQKREQENFDFNERIETLHERLEKLNTESSEIEIKINENINKLLEGMFSGDRRK